MIPDLQKHSTTKSDKKSLYYNQMQPCFYVDLRICGRVNYFSCFFALQWIHVYPGNLVVYINYFIYYLYKELYFKYTLPHFLEKKNYWCPFFSSVTIKKSGIIKNSYLVQSTLIKIMSVMHNRLYHLFADLLKYNRHPMRAYYCAIKIVK